MNANERAILPQHAVSVAPPGRVERVKSHPWRAFNPGWLSSDYQHGQRVIPGHARIVRR